MIRDRIMRSMMWSMMLSMMWSRTMTASCMPLTLLDACIMRAEREMKSSRLGIIAPAGVGHSSAAATYSVYLHSVL
jgi:reverse gyrase